MVSFASPLFWQINYLVKNLNKKNFKSNVAELNQVPTVAVDLLPCCRQISRSIFDLLSVGVCVVSLFLFFC